MIEVAYRIAKSKFSGSHEEMFSGIGAAMYGGRWNTQGNHMAYASECRALATLEISVHLKSIPILAAYSVCQIVIPDGLCEEVAAEDLPDEWDAMAVNPLAAQAWGDLWLEFGKTCVVKVPSVIMPMEWNYLLNPEHEQFKEIDWGVIEPHLFDTRIKGNPIG